MADRNLSNVFVRSRVQISIACRVIRSILQTFPLFNDMNPLIDIFLKVVLCGIQFISEFKVEGTFDHIFI